MSQMVLGRYVPYPSFIHRLDPRIKLFGLIVFMSTLFMRFESIYTDFLMYGITFIAIAIFMRVAHLSFRGLFKQLRALWIMVIFLLVINVLIPYSGPIQGYITVWEGFRIYYGSLAQTFYIVFRLVLMISLTLVLTGTTRPLDLTFLGIRVVISEGMSNNRMVLTFKDNLIYAFDGLDDDKALKAINLEDTTADAVLRTRVNYKIGFHFVNPAEIVFYHA
jgi:hypothetical protein